MTRPRLCPDRPRTCPDTQAWALAAKMAGASIWQIAVFTQREPDTIYKVLQRLGGAMPKGQSTRARTLNLDGASGYSQAAVNATNLERFEVSAHEQLARCERYLAAEPPLRIRWRACPTCGGREAPDQPHHHGAAA